MRRRAHLGLQGHTKVRITTFLSQKTFDLDELHNSNKYVDLAYLKKIDHPNNFYMEVSWGSGKVGDPYVLEVRAHEQEDYHLKWSSVVARLSIEKGYDRETTVEVTLVE